MADVNGTRKARWPTLHAPENGRVPDLPLLVRILTTGLIVSLLGTLAIARETASEQVSVRGVLERSVGGSEVESEALQLTSSRIVRRSGARTAAGSTLVVLGLVLAAVGSFQCDVAGPDAGQYSPPLKAVWANDECRLDSGQWLWPGATDVYAVESPDWRIVGAGAGLAGIGVLLMTVFADVDVKVSNNVEFAVGVQRQGPSVGARISW